MVLRFDGTRRPGLGCAVAIESRCEPRDLSLASGTFVFALIESIGACLMGLAMALNGRGVAVQLLALGFLIEGSALSAHVCCRSNDLVHV